MHDGMLIELMDGELNQAVDWYQGLLTALPEDDPPREQLTYWMARAYVSSGDLDAAHKALQQLEQSGTTPERVARLLARIKGLSLQIQSLPVHHSFRSGTENWVHSWSDPDKGHIGLERPDSGGNRTLAWTTHVE